ncbi:MAG: 4Fe-4S dicluster domain-containing protein [Bacillota bacterium]
MIEKTGIPTGEDLKKVLPRHERLAKGPVAVVECFQEIPCNPCYTACRSGAITPFQDINHLPTIDHDKCNGCTLCISKCPGLAIFVVDDTYAPDKTVIKMPYEMLPVPEKGQEVMVLDREGQAVGKGVVVGVQSSKLQDRTLVIAVAVDKELRDIVRCFRMGDGNER